MPHAQQITVPLTAFGETLIAEPTPKVSADAIYGLRSTTDMIIETDGASGSVTLNENSNGGREFLCQSGTTAGGYAIFKTKRAIRYRPGVGILARFTARFDGHPIGGSSRVGLRNRTTELSFGYAPTGRFGILYRTGAKQEIRVLTLTVAAGISWLED